MTHPHPITQSIRFVVGGSASRLLSLLLAMIAALVFSGATALAAQKSPGEAEPRKERTSAPKKKTPAYEAIEEKAGLPRVLIIGDSISIGYQVPVRKLLEGKANVLRPAENCSDTSKGVKRIDAWLAAGSGRWDVIHFNFGLHDLKYLDEKGKYVTPDKGKQVSTLETYEKNLRAIVARMKQTGAKLIFATTTQVPAGSNGRVEGDEIRYNEVAKRVMREEGVEVDDLHAFLAPRIAKLQLPKNVHFTAEGSEELGKVVAESIGKALAKK